ncbi:MAG: hypothetical protein AB7F50_05165 [Fimbriimonadaceae bacterium]
MTSLILGVALVQAPSISFQDGVFRLQVSSKSHTVAIQPSLAHSNVKGTFAWASNGAEVRFDKGGLRAGKAGAAKKVSLKAFATSPRFQSGNELHDTIQLIQKGDRSVEPSALSGYEVVDGELVLLFRWVDKKGKPWLEALAVLAQGESGFKAVGLGRLDGIGFGSGIVDDELYLEDGRLAAPTNFDGKFGIASLAPDGSDRKFRRLGEEVGGVAWRPDVPQAFVTRPAGEGSISISSVDTESGAWRSALEYRGRIGNLLPEGWAKLLIDSKPWAANLWTGARAPLPANSNMEHTPFGLLVWAPADAPKQAWLYDGNARQIRAWRASANPY